jgi:hypothetical protein
MSDGTIATRKQHDLVLGKIEVPHRRGIHERTGLVRKDDDNHRALKFSRLLESSMLQHTSSTNVEQAQPPQSHPPGAVVAARDPGWQTATDPSGRTYYYNHALNQSTYEIPAGTESK